MKDPFRTTQLNALRHHFVTNPMRWISLDKLYSVSGTHALPQRILDLREDGMYIENQLSRGIEQGDVKLVSLYRYVPDELVVSAVAEFDVQKASLRLENQLLRSLRKWPQTEWPAFSDKLREFFNELNAFILVDEPHDSRAEQEDSGAYPTNKRINHYAKRR